MRGGVCVLCAPLSRLEFAYVRRAVVTNVRSQTREGVIGGLLPELAYRDNPEEHPGIAAQVAPGTAAHGGEAGGAAAAAAASAAANTLRLPPAAPFGLRLLGLSNNRELGDGGAELLADVLRRSGGCPLEVLHLAGCDLTDRAAVALGRAIGGNVTLQTLNIGGNRVTHVGVASILERLARY